MNGDAGESVTRVWLLPKAETERPCENTAVEFDFDPTPRDFNADHAFWMMWFSERVFFTRMEETREELARVGFTSFEVLSDDRTGLELYVAASSSAVVVAFRGSTQLDDWVTNFTFALNDGADHGLAGHVHRGYATSLEPKFDALVELVRRASEGGKPIWLTGHSLGAAQATMAATRLARLGIQVGPLYTYASPRVGDAVFAEDAFAVLGGRAYRIVHELDVVPHVPPAANAAAEAAKVLPLAWNAGEKLVDDLDYRHVGQKMWFKERTGNELVPFPPMNDDDDEPYWRSVSRGGTVGFAAFMRDQPYRHSYPRYLCRLFALKNQVRGEEDPNADGPALPQH